jgi:DNA-binding NtrC family response regulator
MRSSAKFSWKLKNASNLPMSTSPDIDLTIPSLVAALPAANRELQLMLTIVFHPDTSRIGERVVIPDLDVMPSWVLGRRSPAFGKDGGPAATPLGERHVSRRAISLCGSGEGLLVRRLPDSSRCRIGGRELRQSLELSRDQLQRGVRVLLGHSVVLLLRLAPDTPPVPANLALQELQGSSPYMAGLRKQLIRLADSGLDVLIRGETGTGKELVAAAIHRAGCRGDRPMVSINMAAIPPGLAASTLFGIARGAFTGATRTNEGFFAQAQGSTLFLDEIGDTPIEVQPQLLRALQQREIQAVGGAIQKVDVRVISATDGALESESCDFKAALRHRLGAGEVRLLPLREHPEDIGELLLHFLITRAGQLGSADQLPGEDSPAREIAAWAALFHSFLGYSWPGNVRELANFAGQVLVASGEELTLPDSINFALMQAEADSPAVNRGAAGSPRRSIRQVDEQEFDNALRESGYEVANVARQLGVSRQAVYRRMGESSRHRLAGQVPGPELEKALAVCEGDARAAAMDLKVSVSGLRSRLRDSSLLWF